MLCRLRRYSSVPLSIGEGCSWSRLGCRRASMQQRADFFYISLHPRARSATAQGGGISHARGCRFISKPAWPSCDLSILSSSQSPVPFSSFYCAFCPRPHQPRASAPKFPRVPDDLLSKQRDSYPTLSIIIAYNSTYRCTLNATDRSLAASSIQDLDPLLEFFLFFFLFFFTIHSESRHRET